jgi:hypothetical protein
MNLLEARVALRPRAMSDVIDLAGPFCLANRRLMLPLTLLTTGLGALLAFFLRHTLAWTWTSVWAALAGYLLVANGVFTQAAGELLFRSAGDIRVPQVLGRFARRLLPFLVARVIHLIVLGLSAALFVLLPVYGARLFFFGEAVLLESGSPLASLARSSRLVLYRSLPCLGLAVACLCAPFLFAVVADLIGETLVNLVLQMGRPFGSLWSDGGSGFAVIGTLVSAPFVASASFLGYVDMRTRKEGWDIQLRFMAIAEADASKRRMAS